MLVLMITTFFSSPIGTIRMTTSANGLQSLEILNNKVEHFMELTEGTNDYVKQFKEYFSGDRKSFDLPLDPMGTDFQKAVWRAALSIPYGETRTYGEIAEMIGRPLAVRAVGTTLGRNPLCIIVPCHRVLPKSGEVGEYAYGTQVKEWLLNHEKTHSSVAKVTSRAFVRSR